MRQLLIVAGLALVGLGIIWPWLSRIGFGHLPGDVHVERPGFSFYAPLGSSLLISVILSLALILLGWLFRR